jgi:hypothetical protein
MGRCEGDPATTLPLKPIGGSLFFFWVWSAAVLALALVRRQVGADRLAEPTQTRCPTTSNSSSARARRSCSAG